MEKPGAFNFKVGQLVETKSFEIGYRGAWFRGEIKDIKLKKNQILVEYYDFDVKEATWEKIYDVPPYGRKSKSFKQLMVRPQYPVSYKNSEMPPINSITQVCVIFDGTWKVGDMVDWFEESSFWSAKVVKVLKGDKYQIELPMAPEGERKGGEDGRHVASGKHLRPFLDWSEREGWTLPTVEGQTPCAQLIFPNQGMDSKVEHAAAEAAGSPVNASSTTRTSAEGDGDVESEQSAKKLKMDLEVEHAAAATVSHVNASSTPHISADGDGESEQKEKNVNLDLEVEHAAATVSHVKASSTQHISAEGVRDGESEQNDKIVNMDLEVEPAAVPRVNASSTSHISAAGDADVDGESEQNDRNVKMVLEVEPAAAAYVSPVNASSTTRISAEGDKDGESDQNDKNVKMDCDLMESSESSSSLRVGKKAAEKRKLNIMHEDTLEATVIDLEELVNKVSWMQRLLQSPTNHSTTSWKLA